MSQPRTPQKPRLQPQPQPRPQHATISPDAPPPTEWEARVAEDAAHGNPSFPNQYDAYGNAYPEATPEPDNEVRAPAGSFRVVTENASFYLDPIEALMEMNRIAAARDGCTNFEWLTDFREWLKQYAGGRLIPLGAVDALWDELRGKYNLAKKKRLERLNSLISTTSSPAEPAS